jgi:hypothetical protein
MICNYNNYYKTKSYVHSARNGVYVIIDIIIISTFMAAAGLTGSQNPEFHSELMRISQLCPVLKSKLGSCGSSSKPFWWW